MRNTRNQVEFVVKFKTKDLVDLEYIMPSRVLTMDDVRIETDGFIPRGNPLMHLMALSAREYAYVICVECRWRILHGGAKM